MTLPAVAAIGTGLAIRNARANSGRGRPDATQLKRALGSNPPKGQAGLAICNIDGGNSSFQLIALDDSEGPLLLEQDAVLSVTYAPSNASFTLNNGVLELTADPPLESRQRCCNRSEGQAAGGRYSPAPARD